MRSALEWAQVRALVADGISQREIASRLGINRRTVARLLASDGPPRYRRPPTGSQLDPLEPVLRRLVASLPYSGAQTAFFSLDMTIESFLEGHARAFEWLGGVPRECVYDNLRAVVARREGDEIVWNRRFLHLRGHSGFHATACTPATPREKGSVEAAVRYLKTGFWPARRFAELRFDWSGQRSSRVPIDGYLRQGRCFYRAPERLVHERVELRFDRDQVWICHRGSEVARYPRSYQPGVWLPPPILRAEPPLALPAVVLPRVTVAPPELADYAELCA